MKKKKGNIKKVYIFESNKKKVTTMDVKPRTASSASPQCLEHKAKYLIAMIKQ